MSSTITNILPRKRRNSTYRDFEKLYGFYFKDLCNFTLKYGFNKESAEEIVSDVFMKIWEKKDRLNFNFSIRSYLFTSVKNHCIDHLRKNKKHFLVSNLIPLDRASPYASPEDQYIYLELDNRVNMAIDSLPPECKKIFKMSRYNGLKYREIADKLNISVKTVEAQMSKALRRLKLKLKLK